MKVHKLKLNPQWIDSITTGKKKAEIRYNDRNYKVGDVIEFVGMSDVRFRITNITEFPQWLREWYVVLSLEKMNIGVYNIYYLEGDEEKYFTIKWWGKNELALQMNDWLRKVGKLLPYYVERIHD